MKVLLILAAVVIGFQAIVLLNQAQERNNFHLTLKYLEEFLCGQPIQKCCMCLHEEIRYMVVAFTLAAAYLLFTGEAVWPALLAQFMWIGTQNLDLIDFDVYQMRTLIIQLLIFFILFNGCECEQKKPQKESRQVKEEGKEKVEIGEKKVEEKKSSNKKHDKTEKHERNEKKTKRGK